MALFVPHSGNAYASGLGSLAEAIAAAPLNRARLRQMEIDAANVAADNARADAANRLAVQKAAEERRQWGITNGRAAAAEGRAVEKFPLEMQGLELGNEEKTIANEFAPLRNAQTLATGDLDIASKTEANRQALLINPLTVQKTQAEVDKALMENGLEDVRIQGLQPTADSLADTLYRSAQKTMPQWNLKDLLTPGSAGLPTTSQFSPTGEPPPSLPGVVDSGMDYPGMGNDSGMDEISRRMGVRDDMQTLAEQAVLSDKTLNTGTWLKDNAKPFIAAEPATEGMLGEDDPTWTGTGGANDANRIIDQVNLMVAQGKPVPQQLALAYRIAYADKYGEKTEIRKNAFNQDVPIKIRASVPQGIVSPDMLNVSPQGGSQVSQVAPGVSPVSPAGGGAPVPQGTAQGNSQANANLGVTVGDPLSPIPPADITATQAQNAFRAYTMSPALQAIAEIAGYDPKTRRVTKNDQIPGPLELWATKQPYGNRAAQFVTGNDYAQRWDGNLFAAVDPIVRMATGAALNPSELPNYQSAWMPKAGDSERANLDRFERLVVAQHVFQELSKDSRFSDLSKMEDEGAALAMNQMYQDFVRSHADDPVLAPLVNALPENQGQAPGGDMSQQSGAVDLDNMSLEELQALRQQMLQQGGPR